MAPAAPAQPAEVQWIRRVGGQQGVAEQQQQQQQQQQQRVPPSASPGRAAADAEGGSDALSSLPSCPGDDTPCPHSLPLTPASRAAAGSADPEWEAAKEEQQPNDDNEMTKEEEDDDDNGGVVPLTAADVDALLADASPPRHHYGGDFEPTARRDAAAAAASSRRGTRAAPPAEAGRGFAPYGPPPGGAAAGSASPRDGGPVPGGAPVAAAGGAAEERRPGRRGGAASLACHKCHQHDHKVTRCPKLPTRGDTRQWIVEQSALGARARARAVEAFGLGHVVRAETSQSRSMMTELPAVAAPLAGGGAPADAVSARIVAVVAPPATSDPAAPPCKKGQGGKGRKATKPSQCAPGGAAEEMLRKRAANGADGHNHEQWRGKPGECAACGEKGHSVRDCGKAMEWKRMMWQRSETAKKRVRKLGVCVADIGADCTCPRCRQPRAPRTAPTPGSGPAAGTAPRAPRRCRAAYVNCAESAPPASCAVALYAEYECVSAAGVHNVRGSPDKDARTVWQLAQGEPVVIALPTQWDGGCEWGQLVPGRGWVLIRDTARGGEFLRRNACAAAAPCGKDAAPPPPTTPVTPASPPTAGVWGEAAMAS